MRNYTLICKTCGTEFESKTPRIRCFSCASRFNEESLAELCGKRFRDTKLTILGFELRQGIRQKIRYAKYRCDCGTEKWTLWGNIRCGNVNSCGCLRRESLAPTYKRRRESTAKRNQALVDRLVDTPGITYQALADSFGISKQRVAQILYEYGKVVPGVRRRNHREAIRLENDRLRAIVAKNGLTIEAEEEKSC